MKVTSHQLPVTSSRDRSTGHWLQITGYSRKSSPAFSLIELLVVIAIIGILSSIVMASLSSARLRSRDSRRLADMKQVQIGLELYYDEYGQYPNCQNASNFSACFVEAMEVLRIAGYLPSTPADPVSSSADPYVYTPLPGGSTSKCKSYHLGATLEDANNSTLKDAAFASGVTQCALAPNTTDFSANAKATCGKGSGTNSSASVSGTNRCYDMKP